MILASSIFDFNTSLVTPSLVISPKPLAFMSCCSSGLLAFYYVFHVSQFSSSAAPEHGCSNCGPCIYALLSKPDGQHHCTVSRNTFKPNLSSSRSLFRMSPSSPSSYSLVGNLSGMLLNTDMVLDYPRPQPPTFLNIGGIQVTLISLCRVLSPSSGEGEPRTTT